MPMQDLNFDPFETVLFTTIPYELQNTSDSIRLTTNSIEIVPFRWNLAAILLD